MNSDNNRSVEVALGNGVIVTANRETNSDLFWAVRGGTGGNFGIVLSVTYNLVSVGNFYGWSVAWPLATETDRANAANALLFFQQNFMRTAPAGFSSQVSFCFQPSDPYGGGGPLTPWLLVRGAYGGNANQPKECDPAADQPPRRSVPVRYLRRHLQEPQRQRPPVEAVPGSYNPQPDAERGQAGLLYRPQPLRCRSTGSILDWFVTARRTPGPTPTSRSTAARSTPIRSRTARSSTGTWRSAPAPDVFWQSEAQRPAAEQFLSQWVDLMTPLSNKRVYQNYPSLAVPDYRAAYWGPPPSTR